MLADSSISSDIPQNYLVTLLTAKQKTTASFDLHKSSMDYVEAIGPTAAHVLNLSPSDNTHLNDNGALVFGRYTLLG
jgi:hypothetical protein